MSEVLDPTQHLSVVNESLSNLTNIPMDTFGCFLHSMQKNQCCVVPHRSHSWLDLDINSTSLRRSLLWEDPKGVWHGSSCLDVGKQKKARLCWKTNGEPQKELRNRVPRTTGEMEGVTCIVGFAFHVSASLIKPGCNYSWDYWNTSTYF